MLTDMMVEEEFEIKEEKSWYSKQDLEHDLHLAAELGKALLDRNHELVQGLQQLYSTRQEQLQEIEYLSKQVERLRQMNDQHIKVYEQLDTTARDLEQGNHQLVLDNRLAQHKIQGLSQTIEGLQEQIKELHQQVEVLRNNRSYCTVQSQARERRRDLGAKSVSCLRELYTAQRHRVLEYSSSQVGAVWTAADATRVEEENAALKGSVQALQTQLGTERGRHEEVERETRLLAQENRHLERRLAELEGCRARRRELELQVEELRQLWRSESASGWWRADKLSPDSVLAPPEEEEEEEEAEPEVSRLRSSSTEELLRGHEPTCIRRARAVKQRGISLLNEVDAQYSALQAKYEKLLVRCLEGTDELSHKAVQTPTAQAQTQAQALCPVDDARQPEYKALFQELFICIQKTKDNLSENRGSLSNSDASASS